MRPRATITAGRDCGACPGIPAPLKHPPNQRSMLQLRSAKHRLVLKRSDVAVSLRRLAARAADRLPLRRRRPALAALTSFGGRSQPHRADSTSTGTGPGTPCGRRASPRRGNRSAFFEWRFDEYPLFREFSDSGEISDGQIVLDYGCRPGNGSGGLRAPHGCATDRGDRRVPKGARAGRGTAGTSPDRPGPCRAWCWRPTAKSRSRSRTARLTSSRARESFTTRAILKRSSVSWLASSRPMERARSWSTTATASGSTLYTAYERMVVQNAFPGADVHEAFRRNTDGPECPISRSYVPEEFTALCGSAGRGGVCRRVPVQTRTRLPRALWGSAIADRRLPSEHREFLRSLTFDFEGRPMFDGRHAGIGGTYRLRKPSRS